MRFTFHCFNRNAATKPVASAGKHLCVWLCATLMMGWGCLVNAEPTEAELQVRAQFVYNFANFVDWPGDAFEEKSAPIKICLFGNVKFAPYLYTYSGTLIGERELLVKPADTFDQIRSGCHILYVGEDERVRLPTFWKQIKYIYVLSIGERTGFADRGGIINILRTRDRVQFDVNIENAINNGLFLDSDLLALARIIKRNTDNPNDAPSGVTP